MSPQRIARMRIEAERCTGCGECVPACPEEAISLRDGIACIAEDLCRSCEACVPACPQGAIVAVRQGETLPAPATVTLTRPQVKIVPTRESPLARVAARALPAVGTALAVIGRDVILRAAEMLVDRWTGEPDSSSLSSPRSAASPPASEHGGRHRYRGGRA